MEGDRRLVLREPPATTKDEFGQPVPAGEGNAHVVYATRRDFTGGKGEEDDVFIREGRTRFRVRQAGISSLSADWTLEDEKGRLYDIEDVSEDPVRRGRWWIITATVRA